MEDEMREYKITYETTTGEVRTTSREGESKEEAIDALRNEWVELDDIFRTVKVIKSVEKVA